MSNIKKLLFLLVCSERWDEGGAHIVHPLEIARQLIKDGHEVRLFIPKVNKLAQEIDIPYEMIPAPRWFKGSSFLFFELLLPFYLARHIRRSKYSNKKIVLYTRHRELGLTSIITKEMFRIPFVDEYNDIVWETLASFAENAMYSRFERFIKSNPLLKKFLQSLEKLMFRHADAIIAVTPELKIYIVETARVPERKVSVVPNGCNIETVTVLDKQKCRQELKLDPKKTYLCHIGSLNPWQGIDDVLDSLALLVKERPDTTLLLVGEGPYQKTLEQKVTALGISAHVLFTGHVPHEKITLYIGASDVCMFLKKLTSYGLSSLKLYEYLAAGRPIIGRDIPSIQFIKDQDIGTLLPLTASADAVKNAIMAFLDRPDLALVSQRARHLAETTYNWTISARKIAEICQTL
jgi:glycosyltransferase involved in cell wall biosynthesis